MNVFAATELIYQNFITKWGNRTPFSLDNEKASETGPDIAYCLVTVEFANSGQITLNTTGSRKFDRLGVLIVVVSVPLAYGVAEINGHIDKLIGDWEQVRLDDELWFKDVSIQSVPTRNSGMYSKIFEADFTVMQIR